MIERCAHHSGLILVSAVVWALLVWLAPSSIYWRDSGEFVVQAAFLDIAHPAGFPVYSQIANLFSLLPFGPLPWRIVLCSAIGLVASIAVAVRMLTTKEVGVRSIEQGMIAIIFYLLCALFLPLAFKQAQSAEVYTLYALFVTSCGFLLYQGMRLEDVRYFYLMGFVGGLALGVHVASLFSGLGYLIVGFVASRRFRHAFWGTIFFCILGGASYLYLPIRAQQHLPLNTGAPKTLERLWYVISDARDRLLRTTAFDTEYEGKSAGFEKLVSNPLPNMMNDAVKLGMFDRPLLSAILLGTFLIGFKVSPLITAILLTGGLGNYLFFSGWDGDPWIIFVISLSSFIIVPVMHCTHRTLRFSMLMSLLIVFVTMYFGEYTRLVSEMLRFKEYRTPQHIVSNWLTAGQHTLFMSEQSWFIVQYLQTIEGLRDDAVVIYQPSVLFPLYFKPLQVSLNHETQIDCASDRCGEYGLKTLIESAVKVGGIVFEPNRSLNQYLSGISSFSKEGSAQVVKPLVLSKEESLPQVVELRHEIDMGSLFISGDVRNYQEHVLSGMLDLLSRMGRGEEAIALFSKHCEPLISTPCALSVLNQKGLILMALKQFSNAAEYYRQLRSIFISNNRVLLVNQELAEAQAKTGS